MPYDARSEGDSARPDPVSERRRQLDLWLRALNRHKWVVVAFVVASTAATVVYTLRQPKLYRAAASIVLNARPPSYLDDMPDVAELGARDRWSSREEFFSNEIAVMTSTEVARLAVETHALDRDATFVGEAAGTPDGLAYAIARVRGAISASRGYDSTILYVSAEDGSPERAAFLANAVVQAYADNSLERRLAETRHAMEWLDERRAALGEEVVAAEEKLLEFKRENILLTPRKDGRSLVDEDLIDLRAALMRARLERIAMESRKRALADFLAMDPLAVSAERVVDSPLIQTLKSKYVVASEELEGIKARYGPAHPNYKTAAAKVAWLRDNLDREVRNILSSLDAESKRARDEERSIEAMMTSAAGSALEIAEKDMRYARLKREMETGSERIYDLVLEAHKETALAAMLPGTNIRWLERAAVPGAPFAPNMPRNVALAFMLGLLGGLGLVFAFEQLDQRLRSPDEVERRFGIPFLGVIPLVSAPDRPAGTPTSEDEGRDRRLFDVGRWNQPDSKVAEALRTVRTNLGFKGPRQGLRSLTVTSAAPREGKTTVASHLAATLAAGGRRVLLVDADLRRPRVHRAFELDNSEGLTSVLLGDVTPEQAIVATRVPGLSVLTTGPTPTNPAEALGSIELSALHDELVRRFDMVIYDTPPLLAFSDPLILAPLTDGVLMVIRASETRRDALATAVKNLRLADAKVFGFVMNGVNPNERTYGYYYYQEQYRRTYRNAPVPLDEPTRTLPVSARGTGAPERPEGPGSVEPPRRIDS